MKYSPDVQTALDCIVRHLRVQVHGARASLEVEGKWAIFAWEIHEPGVEAIDQVGDGAIAVYYNILRELCGPDWQPTEAWFAHRRPADVTPFREFFRVPLRFDAEQFALVFPAALLKRRLPEVDAQLRRLLQREIDVLEERDRDDFPQQVRSVLRTALLTGHLKADHVGPASSECTAAPCIAASASAARDSSNSWMRVASRSPSSCFRIRRWTWARSPG